MDAMLLCESNMMVAATFGLDGVPREPLVTIAKVVLEDQEKDKKTGKSERWGILYFKEAWAKPYKVNKTARKALITMFGRETDNWINKRLLLYAAPGYYFGEEGVAVRIKGSPDLTEKKSFQMKKFGGGKITYDLIPGGAPSSRSAAPSTPAPADRGPSVAASAPTGHGAATPTQPATPKVKVPKVATEPAPISPNPPPPSAAPMVKPPPGTNPNFGPYKTRAIAELDDAQLLETVAFGEEKIAASPKESWVPSVTAEITRIRGELEKRYQAKMAAEDAKEAEARGAAALPSRIPGSDDGEEGGSTVPPF